MIVTCPSCEAQYILPDEAVGPRGRRVKCSSCAYTWLQAAAGEEVTQDFTEYREETPPSTHAARPPVDPSRMTVEALHGGTGRAALLGALGGFAFFVATFVFLIVIRHAVAAGWPPSALLFEKIGLEVPAPGTGFLIDEVQAELVTEISPAVLNVKGKLVNDTAHDRTLPNLLVRLSGKDGWLKDWSIELYGKNIPPGESANFEYTLADSPAEGQELVVRFTD